MINIIIKNVRKLGSASNSVRQKGDGWLKVAEQEGPESVKANEILTEERKEFQKAENTAHSILDAANAEAEAKTSELSSKIDRISSQTDQVFDTFGQMMDRHTGVTDEEAEKDLARIMGTFGQDQPGIGPKR